MWLSRDQVASVLLSDYFNLIEKYQVVIAHTHGDKRDFKKPPKNLTSSLYSIWTPFSGIVSKLKIRSK